MPSMTKLYPLRVGCVPEHFFSPLFQAATAASRSAVAANGSNTSTLQSAFERAGLDVTVEECGTGTGTLVSKLRSGELDVAFCVYEGLVAAACKPDADDSIRIVGTYVESPLQWSVATGASSPFTDIASLASGNKGSDGDSSSAGSARIGISRAGSGSHVMGMYMVQSNGLEPSNFGYSVCGDIRGLSGAAERGDIDAFLWENFTTKPYYDSGVLRRLGIVLAPWSSFLIGQRRTSTPATAAAATTAPADLQLQNAIDTFLNVLQESVEQFADPAPQTRAHAIEYLSKRFGYSKADATAWIEGVSYTKTATGRVQLREVDRAVMEKCMSVLKAAGAIDHARSPQDICVQGVLAN